MITAYIEILFFPVRCAKSMGQDFGW